MGCGVLWSQVREAERALGVMRRLGIGELTEPYQVLFRARGALLARIGFKYPKTVSAVLKLLALSPGSVTLWHDVECGWMTEARRAPGAPPVYRHASDEVAAALLKGELTHELEETLMTPEEVYEA